MNRKKKKQIILIAVIVLIIAGMALYPTLKRKFFSPSDGEQVAPVTSQNAERKALNVNALILSYQPLEDMIVTKGRLLPDEEADLSFETSGMLKHIYFKEGSSVRKGELLAKVNDEPLQAELKKLEAQLPLANDRVYRQEQLFSIEAVSLESLETVRTELAKLKADIEIIKARIAQTELRAPFDGEIGLRNISEGIYASPSTVITRITKIRPLKVEFSVNEAQSDAISMGKSIEFTIDGKSNPASIYAVDPMVTLPTYTRMARATYPNSDGRLKPGRSVDVELKRTSTKNALLIPAISLTPNMGRDYVYVYRNGTARQTPVTKGLRNASSIQIVDGLIPGDTILTSGVMQLRDGMPVEISKIDSIQ